MDQTNKKNNNEEEMFATKEFYLAVSLVAAGVPLLDIKCNELPIMAGHGKKTAFDFYFSTEKAKPVVTSFWDGSLEVNAKSVYEAAYQLKNSMRELS